MRILLIITSGILLQVNTAFAWGSRGHKIVAQIAKHYLDKSIIDSVQHYLGTTTFEQAAVWMDEVRSDHNYDFLKPMHYINIDPDKTYVKTDGPNIMNALNTVYAQLQDRKKLTWENTKTNVLILFHLVGDLHMPLHSGFGEDKGGNAVEVDFLGNPSNLHKVWDTNIIEAENIITDDCLAVLKQMPPDEIKSISQVNFETWMNDSRKLLTTVYKFNDHVIDQNYVSSNAPIVKKQLAMAGVRLASALTTIFSKGSKA